MKAGESGGTCWLLYHAIRESVNIECVCRHCDCARHAPVKYLSCLLTGLEMKVHLVPLTQPHWPQLPLLQKQVRSPLPTVLGLSQPPPLSRSSAAAVRGLRTTWQATRNITGSKLSAALWATCAWNQSMWPLLLATAGRTQDTKCLAGSRLSLDVPLCSKPSSCLGGGTYIHR